MSNESDQPIEASHAEFGALRVKVDAIEVTLVVLNNKLDHVVRGIFGDTTLDQPGLVLKVSTLEKVVAHHDRKILTWSAFAAGVGYAATELKNRILGP